MKKKHLLITAAFIIVMGGCTVSNIGNLGSSLLVPSTQPSASSPGKPINGASPTPKPSASNVASGPVCLQQLQCIADKTASNALRKETQEVIDELFSLGDPDYTRVCTSRSTELVEQAPECRVAAR